MVGLMAVLYIHKSLKIWAILFWLVCCFQVLWLFRSFFFIFINIQKSGLVGLGGWRGPDIVSIYDEYRNNIFMKIINNMNI